MRIGYGKIGRVMEMSSDKWGESGGDNEPATLLLTLAQRHPDVTWVAIGKNSGWVPPLPNIENPWQGWKAEVKPEKNDTVEQMIARLDRVTMSTIAELDQIVLWMGQHGTSNSPIPKVDDPSVVTSPQISFVHYTSFLLRGINAWRRDNPLTKEEVWLLPDVRNYLKGRDLKWPRLHPILSQFDWSRDEWCERYGDTRSPQELGFGDLQVTDGKWRSTDHYIGSGLELVGVPAPMAEMPQWEDRSHFGILINEARNYGMRPELTRGFALKHYIRPLDPAWIHGTWTAATMEKLGTSIQPAPYDQIFNLMASSKSTFTTPSSGSGWATAKPWEAFSTGTICFFHPAYDTQGHIIPTLAQAADDDLGHLARWLRVTSPDQLKARVAAVESSRETYEWLRDQQLKLLVKEQEVQRCVTTIEKRVGLA